MTRRGATATLVVAIAAAGGLVAHQLAYALAGVPPDGVHDYLRHLPAWLALLALLAAAASSAAAGPAPRAWPFAAVGLVGFVLQEHLEQLAHTGTLPWLLDRPVLLIGIALQLPFALAAWCAARCLLAVAAAVRRAQPPRLRSRAPALLVPAARAVVRAGPLALAHPLRGPPRTL